MIMIFTTNKQTVNDPNFVLSSISDKILNRKLLKLWFLKDYPNDLK